VDRIDPLPLFFLDHQRQSTYFPNSGYIRLIDSDVLAKLRLNFEHEENGELNRLLRTEDSVTYLDYLRACEVELNVPEQEYPLFLRLHRDLIRSCLRKYVDRPSVLQKYEWLKSYHNRTLLERFGTAIPADLEV